MRKQKQLVQLAVGSSCCFQLVSLLTACWQFKTFRQCTGGAMAVVFFFNLQVVATSSVSECLLYIAGLPTPPPKKNFALP